MGAYAVEHLEMAGTSWYKFCWCASPPLFIGSKISFVSQRPPSGSGIPVFI